MKRIVIYVTTDLSDFKGKLSKMQMLTMRMRQKMALQSMFSRVTAGERIAMKHGFRVVSDYDKDASTEKAYARLKKYMGGRVDNTEFEQYTKGRFFGIIKRKFKQGEAKALDVFRDKGTHTILGALAWCGIVMSWDIETLKEEKN